MTAWERFVSNVPDGLVHPYGWPDDKGEVTVYRGPLVVEYRDEDPQHLDGALTVSWAGRSSATWQAVRTEAELSYLKRLLADATEPVSVSAPTGATPRQVLLGAQQASLKGETVSGQIPGGVLAVGDGSAVDRLDFLLLNGPQAHDLGHVRNPTDPDTAYRGRVNTTGGGWSLTVDQHPDAVNVFQGLRENGGKRVTHAGRLSRTDGSAFDAQDGVEAAHGVAAAYSFAASRRCAPVLFVGSAAGTVRWAKATRPSVDVWADRLSWTDPTHMHGQLSAVLTGWLDQWADPANALVLRLALGYHLVASDTSSTNTAVFAGIAGLVLLSEARFVGGGRMSESKWQALHTAGQIRLLLDAYGVATTANPAYGSLHTVALADRANNDAKKAAEAARKGKTFAPRTDAPDDLDGIIALRNLVAHPSALARGTVPAQAWVEAWLTVAEWLDLALLARVGHSGRYFPRRQENRWQGSSISVPFPPTVGLLGP